jgi:hypothetical protein
MNPSTSPIARAATSPSCSRSRALDVAEHQGRQAEVDERSREAVLILLLPTVRQALLEEGQRALVLAALKFDVAEIVQRNAEQPEVAQLARKPCHLHVEVRRLIPVAGRVGNERGDVDAKGRRSAGICLHPQGEEFVCRCAAPLEVALPDGEQACAAERVDAKVAIALGVGCKRQLEPTAPLAPQPSRHPEEPDRAGETKCDLGTSMLERVAEDGTEVVVLGLEPVEPH